jgi:hypothetical protein
MNYWAVINGSLTDYVGGMSLTKVGSVALVADRLGNALGAFQTVSNSYAQAPAGNYFNTGSFSITIWTNKMDTIGQVWMDFANGQASDNVILVSNHPSVCSYAISLEAYNTGYSLYCSGLLSTVGAWTHVAATYNLTSQVGSVYVNGLFVGSGTGLVRNLTRLYNYFGHDAWNGFANLQFDEIKFHGRVLTAQEVLADFYNNASYISFI